jgi:hypothetical protein
MKHLYLCLFLVACGPSAEEAGPGGVSVEDARALDAAAEKLDTEAQISPPTQILAAKAEEQRIK